MRKRAIVVVLCVVAWSACKKTVESESKAWEEQRARVQALVALYPGFAEGLKAQLQQAQQAMDAAKAISDHEQSIQKMAEANGVLRSGLCHAVDRADYRLKTLEARHRSQRSSVGARKELLVARSTLEDARLELKTAASLLKEEGSIASATIRLRRIERTLDKAESGLADVAARLREYDKEKSESRRAQKKKR